jgi:hypothetical protein
MRFFAGTIANAAAWIVLIALVTVAFVMVVILGPFGLVILGLATLCVCTAVQLHEGTPTWGKEVFGARMAAHGTPEQRAAMLDETQKYLSPLRFYRWCGAVLLAAGIVGFAWQQWG